ncbi:SIS domain-containing protein [Streptomyces sp. NPDC050560]|uniref:SIS domain-containing protein n=1 Tax=Streptomyces sp. NPDC050560 TaxID=3365630 RepID=UPI0037B98D8F
MNEITYGPQPTGDIGFDEGLSAELTALREVVTDLPGRLTGVWRPQWRHVLLAGIGASCAALATPQYVLRSCGLAAFRTDCSDFPSAEGTSPDVVLALSQSGRSRETAELMTAFRDRGVPTLALTNADTSPLGEAVDTAVTLGGHPDSRVSTVGFVVTFAALSMLTDAATTGSVDGGWVRLPDLITEALAAAAPALDAFASGPLATGPVDVVAAAPQLTTAEAVALLFREGPLVPSAGHGTRTYLHGYMDSAGPRTGHILIGADREARLARQLVERGAGVLAVAEAATEFPPGVHRVSVPPGLTAPQRALVEVCVLQRLVAAVAGVRGNPVDEVAFRREDTKIDALREL